MGSGCERPCSLWAVWFGKLVPKRLRRNPPTLGQRNTLLGMVLQFLGNPPNPLPICLGTKASSLGYLPSRGFSEPLATAPLSWWFWEEGWLPPLKLPCSLKQPLGFKSLDFGFGLGVPRIGRFHGICQWQDLLMGFGNIMSCLAS